MATTKPTDPTKTNCDATTDNPQQSLLTDLANSVDKTIEMLAAWGALAQYDIGGGLGTESQTAGTPDKLQLSAVNTNKTAAYTVVAADRAKLVTCTGTWSLSLTAAATLGDGFFCFVRNTGSGTITIDPNSTELVNGVTTYALAAGESAVLHCTGSAWHLVGNSITESGADTDLSNLSATGEDKIAKAWVNFNGSGVVSIRDSHNVSSITDNGTGDFTVNFTTAFANANYCAVGMSQYDQTAGRDQNSNVAFYRGSGAVATGSCRVVCGDNSGASTHDNTIIALAFFGDQ